MRQLILLLLLAAYFPLHAQDLIQIRDAADKFSIGIPEEWSFNDEPDNEKLLFQAWLPKSESEPDVQLASISVMMSKLPGGTPDAIVPGMMSSLSKQGFAIADSGHVELRNREILWLDILPKNKKKHIRYYIQMKEDDLWVVMLAGEGEIGEETSDVYDRILVTFSPGDEMLREKPTLAVPVSEKWEQLYETETEDNIESQYLKAGETAEAWKTLIHVLSAKDMVLDDIKIFVDNYEKAEMEAEVKPTFKILEKTATSAIFTVERPGTSEEDGPESSVCYAVQGPTAYHSISVSIREKQLTPEFIKKWSGIFKQTKLIKE